MEKFNKGLDTWNSLSSDGLFGKLFEVVKSVFKLVAEFIDLYKAVK